MLGPSICERKREVYCENRCISHWSNCERQRAQREPAKWVAGRPQEVPSFGSFFPWSMELTCDATLTDAALSARDDDDLLDAGQSAFLRQTSLHPRHRRRRIAPGQSLRAQPSQLASMLQFSVSRELTKGLSWFLRGDDVVNNRVEAKTATVRDTAARRAGQRQAEPSGRAGQRQAEPSGSPERRASHARGAKDAIAADRSGRTFEASLVRR